MKQLLCDTKLQKALLLSTALHLIFIMVVGIVYLQSLEEERDAPIIQIDIVSVPSKRSLKMRSRPVHTPPVSRSMKQVQPQAITRRAPIVNHIAPMSPVAQRNLAEVPLATLDAESVPLASTSNTVGETTAIPSGPQTHGRVLKVAKRAPLRHHTIQKQQSFGLDNPHPLPQIDGLTQSEVALIRIARNILSTRTSDKMDIVFIIDASQSMRNDIEAVRDHLNQMTDLLQAEALDFTIGVVAFRSSTGYSLLGWDFEITAQTNSIRSIKKSLSGIKCRGGEKALDALIHAANKVKFREGVERRFILVTDEYVSGDYSAKEVLAQMELKEIHVDVIGRNEHFQKLIAQRTDGIWLPISSLKN